MTSAPHIREVYFRAVATTGSCGLSVADELCLQAKKRLDIIAKTPREGRTPHRSPRQGFKDGYPFPSMSPAQRHQSSATRKSPSALSISSLPRRNISSLSLASTRSKATFQPSPVKTTVSVVTPDEDGRSVSISHRSDESESDRSRALEALRKVSAASSKNNQHRRDTSAFSIASFFTAHSGRSEGTVDSEAESDGQPRWPALSGWTMQKSPPVEAPSAPTAPLDASIESRTVEAAKAEHKEDTPRATVLLTRADSESSSVCTNGIAATPTISANLAPDPSLDPLRSKPSSASFLGSDHNIAAIDPTLAAAELASTLTKHVCCSVCAVKGVNFPECRKCGIRFCSRECRVSEQGAGNGKRHICGLLESRRGLRVGVNPQVVPSGASALGAGEQIHNVAPSVRAF